MSVDLYDALGLVRTQELLMSDQLLRRRSILDPSHRLRVLENARRGARKVGL